MLLRQCAKTEFPDVMGVTTGGTTSARGRLTYPDPRGLVPTNRDHTVSEQHKVRNAQNLNPKLEPPKQPPVNGVVSRAPRASTAILGANPGEPLPYVLRGVGASFLRREPSGTGRSDTLFSSEEVSPELVEAFGVRQKAV